MKRDYRTYQYDTGQIDILDEKSDPVLTVWPGGTGDCVNLVVDEGDEPFHVCDLDLFIHQLEALRDSEPYKEHVARWA